MPKPVLYVFAISHFCEKACWALDYLHIEFDKHYVAPGMNALLAKKLGAPRSSVPLLVADKQVVQGSGRIIDWADRSVASSVKHLTPASARDQTLEMEKRLDKVLGVHIRRYYYSEALIGHPQTVKPIFTAHLSALQRTLINASWGILRKLMIKGMDLGPAQREQSKQLIEAELDWLDDLLSDGRPFLFGNKFSRIDITAASLLAPIIAPPEHPTYAGLVLPPLARADLTHWEQRRSFQWAREMYRQHRQAKAN